MKGFLSLSTAAMASATEIGFYSKPQLKDEVTGNFASQTLQYCTLDMPGCMPLSELKKEVSSAPERLLEGYGKEESDSEDE